MIRANLKFGNYEDFYMKNGILFKDPVKELIVASVQMGDEITRAIMVLQKPKKLSRNYTTYRA